MSNVCAEDSQRKVDVFGLPLVYVDIEGTTLCMLNVSGECKVPKNYVNVVRIRRIAHLVGYIGCVTPFGTVGKDGLYGEGVGEVVGGLRGASECEEFGREFVFFGVADENEGVGHFFGRGNPFSVEVALGHA